MGNTKSFDNSKITNQLPPSYDEIQIREIREIKTVDPLAPITPEFIKANQELFKANQLREYEIYLLEQKKLIISGINEHVSKNITCANSVCTLYIASDMNKAHLLNKQYRSAELDNLYLQKEFDFICEMYSGFEIKLLEDLPTIKKFKISLKSNN